MKTMLALQNVTEKYYPHLDKISHSLRKDLAGNGFTGAVAGAVLTAFCIHSAVEVWASFNPNPSPPQLAQA